MHPPSRFAALTAASLIATQAIFAQQANESNTVVPIPGPPTNVRVPTGPAAKAVAATGAAENPVTGEEMIPNMQFPNADVKAVLDFYEKLTGKQLVYDNTVQGNVTVNVTKPVTKDEAIRILETALLLNGYTLIPGGDNIVKVIGISKNPRQFGVPIYSDIDQIPEGDKVISFLFRLEYADPQEIVQALQQYIAPSLYTAIVPLEKSQAILITESSTVIRNLERVIGILDHPPAQVVSEFIQLQRADAKDVIEKLNSIFEKKENQQGAPGAPRPPTPGNAGGGEEGGTVSATGGMASTLSEDSLIVGKIKLTADIRTNRIHVITRPVNMPFIRKLIAEFDSDIPFGEPTTRPLRFVSAGDVLDIVVKAITEPGMKAEEGAGGGGHGVPQTNTTINNQPSFGSTAGGTTAGGGSSALGTEELTTANVDTTPEAVTVGNTKIIADKRANSIIVLGNQEVKEKIFKVLDQIDVRAPQVMLTAVIGELDLTGDEEFGVDFLQKFGGSNAPPLLGGSSASGSLVGLLAGAAGGVGLGNVLTAATNAGGTSGGLTAYIAGTNTLNAIVSALESTGRFHVTSRPMVFASNNKKALIASGEQVPVPGNIESTFTGGVDLSGNGGLVSNATVDYKDVDLKLEVNPLINSDKEVTLDIVQEVNDLGSSTVIGGNSVPSITSRKVKTTVSVANEATVVLGGLVTERRTQSKGGIPVLDKIPLLGHLFSVTSDKKERTELLVLIRPTVTTGPVDDVKVSERVQSKLTLQPDLDAALDPKGSEVTSDEKRHELLLPPKPVLRSEK